MDVPDSEPVAAPPRKGLALWAIVLLLVIGGIGGGLLVQAWPQLFARVNENFFSPVAENPAPDFTSDMKMLQARVAAVENQQAQQSEAADKFNAARFAIQDLDARVAKLEAQDPALIMRNAAAAMAVADLIRESESGRPYSAQLELLRGLLPDAPELKQLAQFADTGVPTEALLAARFGSVADRVLASDREAKASGWFDRMIQRLTSLVSVRRVGNVTGDDVESRLARAEALVAAHDLASAVQEMRALPPESQVVAKDWIGDAEARLAVDHDGAALATRLVRKMGTADAMQTP